MTCHGPNFLMERDGRPASLRSTVSAVSQAMWLVDKEGNLVDQNARTGLEEKVKKHLAL